MVGFPVCPDLSWLAGCSSHSRVLQPLSWAAGEVMFPSLAHHARAVSLGTGWQVRRCGLALNRSRPLAPLRGWEEPERAGPVPGYGPSLQIPRVDGEYDLKMPRDMAYVFSGAYTPLSCKIIEQVSLAAAAEHLQAPAALRWVRQGSLCLGLGLVGDRLPCPAGAGAPGLAGPGGGGAAAQRQRVFGLR